MSHCQFHLWEKMVIFMQELPDNQRKLANSILAEGQNVAKHAFRASFDASDSSARALASVVTLRRHA